MLDPLGRLWYRDGKRFRDGPEEGLKVDHEEKNCLASGADGFNRPVRSSLVRQSLSGWANSNG